MPARLVIAGLTQARSRDHSRIIQGPSPMSLFGTLNTAVSGLSAQANYLGTIGDNIANSSTDRLQGCRHRIRDPAGQPGRRVPTRRAACRRGSATASPQQGTMRHLLGDRSRHQRRRLLRGAGPSRHAGPDPGRVLRARRNGNLVNTAGYTLMGYNLTDGSTAERHRHRRAAGRQRVRARRLPPAPRRPAACL